MREMIYNYNTTITKTSLADTKFQSDIFQTFTYSSLVGIEKNTFNNKIKII